ncbi:MAG: hypothetical protein IPM35_04325 [Myxococcales bacterium]|nr:hypothetical protein [Myxococcales bacterium]
MAKLNLSQGLALAVVCTCASAFAAPGTPTKPECFDAHERAQLAQKEKKLRAAKQDYSICANAACPKLVRSECEAELSKIDAVLASVIVFALDAGKSDSTIRVSIDGAPAEQASGPIELEPGEHLLRAETSDGRSVEKRVTLAEGRRNEKVTLDVPAAAPAAPSPEPPPAPAPAPSRISPAVWVLGGVAVIGLGGFVGFGLSGKGQESDLDSCKPDCKRDDVDAMRRSYLLADISLGVALVAGGVGAYLYVSGNKKQQEQGVFVRAVPERQGMGARLGASF